jgi:DNA-directed RNA polymerase beta' subunit
MEMNMHMAQNILAETELRHLPAIPYQIISPSSNSPIIGIYQDSLLGSFQFTRPNITFTPREAMNMLMMFSHVDTKAIREAGKSITNYQILSQILKPITLSYKNKLYGDNPIPNNILEIRNGNWISGQIEKSVMGSATKGVLHRIFNDFGPMACANFIDDLQNIITEYMKTASFSVGISDLIANKTTMESIIQALNKQKIEVQSLIEKVHLGIFENNTAGSNMTEFEIQVNKLLNKATEESGSIGRKSLSKDNRFLMIVNSGSKGSLINISQMISGLGQQNVDGKRIPYGFDSRTLPHYYKYDDGPNARGFVDNSYISGLTAPELFFHAMGGRIGLIDTAIKTSSSGYIQRRLIKGLEDIKIEYDMTVRNSKGKIVQFLYGEDGFDTTRIENQVIPIVGMSIEDIYLHYDILGLNESSEKDMLSVYTKSTATRVKRQAKETKAFSQKYIDKMIKNRDELVDAVFHFKNDNMVKMPVAFQNIIANVQGQLHLNANSIVDITPLECFQMIESYFNKLKNLEFSAPNPLFEILYYYYLSPKDLLVNKRFHTKALTVLLETIVLKYKQSIVHPGEMVGIIAGHSCGEPVTQLTLNSLVYEDEIVVRNSHKQILKFKIGEFTQEHIKRSQKIEYTESKDTTYAELSEYYEVPCANEHGETVWRRIEAVTQHPVVNEDGSNTMLKVTTRGCREITATKAKSFLQLVDGKIQPVNGKDLMVGDYLPVSRKPLEYTEICTLDLKTILPATEYIYGSEFKKACEVMGEYQWWKRHAGQTFTLPYKRSDSVVVAINSDKRCEYKSGYVYTKQNNICNYLVPETIMMDYDFGYLLGAYVAEGCVTPHQISIANNDPAYFEPIIRLCEKWNLTYKMYKHVDKIQKGWTSSDMRIYSTILTRILVKLCGKLSHNKYVAPQMVFSNRECILGFLDAYISGDGCVSSKKRKDGTINPMDIMICSASKHVMMDVMVMLRNLDIDSEVHRMSRQTSNNRGTLPENIHQMYNITIRNYQSQKLASILNLSISAKNERLKLLLDKNFKYEYNKADLYLPNVVDGEIVMEERGERMMDLKFDPIVSIEEVANTTPYAYDLTVEDTRNFDCYHGLCVRDTFHHSGNAAKSNVTRGVPRIEEILRLTKNPKNPSLTVHMKALDEQNQDRAMAYANMMEYTKLVDVVKSIQIAFDPNEHASFIEEDRTLIEQFYAFETIMRECAGSAVDEPEKNTKKSKWIIRIVMDPEALLEKNITMDDIHYAIKNSSYGESIDCVFSDFNEDKLVFRIRLLNEDAKKKKTAGSAIALDQSDEIYQLKNFQDALLNNIVLRGVTRIEKVIPRKLKDMVVLEDGKYVRKDTWVLDTTGSNMKTVLGLDYIDYRRTYSNDIREVFDVLGIEAARQTIYNEFFDVMEFSDAYINFHHLSLLCDRMTMTKDMVPIFRSGILSDDIGPIAKATFEVHTEVLLDAARHADFDHMRGVSSSVMCGQYGNYGTGAFGLVLDMNQMRTLSDAVIASDDRDIDGQFGAAQDRTDTCAKKDLEIQNNIVNIQMPVAADVCDDEYNMGF